MNFLEYLIYKGFNEEVANAICIKVENDLPLTKEQEEFYWEWNNKYIVPKCMKGEK